MSKTLMFRVFGLGKIPRKILPTLEQEGIVLQEEGIAGSVTLRDFMAPGRRSSWRRSCFSGALAITGERFWGFSWWRPVISVPLEREQLEKLELSIEEEDVLRVEFDVAHFHEGWSGTSICRFHTPKARLFLEHLQAQH